MESQPQNPESGINPENFHPCKYSDRSCKSIRISGHTGDLLIFEYV